MVAEEALPVRGPLRSRCASTSAAAMTQGISSFTATSSISRIWHDELAMPLAGQTSASRLPGTGRELPRHDSFAVDSLNFRAGLSVDGRPP